MTSRARQSLTIIVVTLIVLAITLGYAARSPSEERATSRIETVAAVDDKRQPSPIGSARDTWLFHQWTTAVARRAHEQHRAFLEAALELHHQPFLVCVRAHESDTAGGYQATDGGRGGRENMGAYQFDQPTWNTAALAAHAPHLVGVRPTVVGGFDQDRVAWAWYRQVGPSPWAGSGCA